MRNHRSRAFALVASELLSDIDNDVAEAPEGLVVRGQLFAYETEGGSMVVDLPERRARDLIARGIAVRTSGDAAAKGAWVATVNAEDWLELASEAHQFVGEPAVGRQS